MKLSSIMICAITALLPATAFAASSDWIDVGGGRARLVVGEPVPGTALTDAVLEVDLKPGWKTYWRDPGDAGVPLQFDLTASKNAKLLEILYPAPKRFDDGVSVWAGYDAPVAFGIKLERPNVAAPVALQGSAFLGVCDKICVPVKLEFDVEAADSATTTIQREVVALRMAQMPLPPEAGMQVTRASMASNLVTVEVEAFDNGVPPDLFLAAPRGVQFGAPVLKSSGGAKAVFEAGVLYWKPENPDALQPVNYTLVSGSDAVSGLFEIPGR
jgi:DsbC/DsbD-like thiol-disulfide interchange protein